MSYYIPDYMEYIKMLSQKLPRRIYGIDFSGAKDAGKKIWIAGGTIRRGVLEIEVCMKGEELENSGRERGKCLAALRDLMAKEIDCAFGLDFPFGLPVQMVGEKTWKDFILAFPRTYPSENDLREKCLKASPDRELKRMTDIESKTPFSPYNLRVYRQTYYGIRDILNPLVRRQLVCVLPMQHPHPGKPRILEICPASMLKKKNLYRPYKGTGYREQRKRIVESIMNTGSLFIREQATREKIINDSGGDALDSVIAAYSTFVALRDPVALKGGAYRIEGYVY